MKERVGNKNKSKSTEYTRQTRKMGAGANLTRKTDGAIVWRPRTQILLTLLDLKKMFLVFIFIS
jgi:hypothetical protein